MHARSSHILHLLPLSPPEILRNLNTASCNFDVNAALASLKRSCSYMPDLFNGYFSGLLTPEVEVSLIQKAKNQPYLWLVLLYMTLHLCSIPQFF